MSVNLMQNRTKDIQRNNTKESCLDHVVEDSVGKNNQGMSVPGKTKGLKRLAPIISKLKFKPAGDGTDNTPWLLFFHGND